MTMKGDRSAPKKPTAQDAEVQSFRHNSPLCDWRLRAYKLFRISEYRTSTRVCKR